MPDAAAARSFRDAVHNAHLALVTPDADEGRFVFDLEQGAIVTAPSPDTAKKLLDLAKSIYGENQGEARELALLVTRRAPLEDDVDDATIVWHSTERARALDGGAYTLGKWTRFGAWIEDQFLTGFLRF